MRKGHELSFKGLNRVKLEQINNGRGEGPFRSLRSFHPESQAGRLGTAGKTGHTHKPLTNLGRLMRSISADAT